MGKLIYADSLIQDILALPNCYNGFSDTYDKACIIGVIDEQQPVDAVPVVRCKDCKYSVDYYNDGDCYCKRPERNMFWNGQKWDFFCGAGRRKGDGV